MKTTAKELALALGMLVLTTSCTAASNTSTQTQQSPNVTQVRDSGQAATATIKIDGSSTVYPITQAIAKDYQADPKNQVQVAVNISGTSGGFEKFCNGETDISNASRPILKAEMNLTIGELLRKEGKF
jgi:phosphate transport system substrate-binding protein